MSVIIVSADRAGKRYGLGAAAAWALREASLDVAPGEWVALVGRSGSGKTTLLNLLGAMDLPSSGRVLLAGEDTAKLSDDRRTALRRRVVGFVFQAFHLLPTLTVRENIEVPLLLAGEPPRLRAVAIAREVGLEDKLGAFPYELSGGEMQRVALARALVHRPQLVLADEPTGNLDSSTAAAILGLLHQLVRERGAAVVMATHSQEAAGRASRVVELVDGRVRAAAADLQPGGRS
ncbi:MAG: ABC transporter ATP-binding protein [Terriglobales bacterium]